MHLETFFGSVGLLAVLTIGLPWIYITYMRRAKIYPPRGAESRAEALRLLAQNRRGLALRCLRKAEGLSLAQAHAVLDGREPPADEASAARIVLLLLGACCSVWLGISLVSHVPDGSLISNLLGACFLLSGVISFADDCKRLRRKLSARALSPSSETPTSPPAP